MGEKICLFCGDFRIDDIHIHHIDRDTSNNKPENLICLCTLCHHKLHSKIYSQWQRSISQKLQQIELKKNLTYEDIGTVFNLTKQRIYTLLKVGEKPHGGKNWEKFIIPYRNKMIKDLYNKGLRISEINFLLSRTFSKGLSRAFISKIINQK